MKFSKLKTSVLQNKIESAFICISRLPHLEKQIEEYFVLDIKNVCSQKS